MAKDTSNKLTETQKTHGAVKSAKDFPIFEQQNMLTVDKEIAEYLKEQGFVYRFINWKVYKNDANMHRSHWRPYEFDVESISNAHWVGQVNAEGLIRRGDLVLSVRPESMHEEHKKQLAELNRVYSQYPTKKANEFRDFARSQGIKTDITETSKITKRNS